MTAVPENNAPPVSIVPVLGATVMSSGAATTPGRAILITASVVGEVTLVLANGDSITVTVAVGDNIYPFSVLSATTGTATVTRYYNLF